MKISIISFLILIFSINVYTQTILNGDFEINKSIDCMKNLSNGDFNQMMKYCFAFGDGNEIDIQNNNCGWSKPAKGNWFISLSTGTANVKKDGLSLYLDKPLIVGNSCVISYFEKADTIYTKSLDSLIFGISSDSSKYGTQIYSSLPQVQLGWTKKTFTFTVPVTGKYLTIKNKGAERGWNFIDDIQILSISTNENANIESSSKSIFIDSLNCGKSSSSYSIQIKNSGSDTLKLFSIAIEGTNKNEFKIENILNNNILPNQISDLVVSYIPTQFGIHSSRIKIVSNSILDSILYIDLMGRKDNVGIKVDNTMIDFGTLFNKEIKDTVLYIQNIGSIKNNIFASINDNIFLNDKKTLKLETLGIDSLRITFKGSNIEGNFIANLILTDSICNSSKTVQLFCKVNNYPTIQIIAGNDSAYTGEEVIIPVSILVDNKFFNYGIKAVSFELELNKTLLYPIDFKSQIVGDYRIIRFDSVPIKNVGLNEVAKLKFIATLGNAEETPIRIRKVKPIGNTVNFTLIDGNFKLLGVCKEGGNRFINSSIVQSKLISITPNPTTETIEIEFSNADDGIAEIILSNYLGQTILTQKLEKTQTGHKKIDLSELPSGQYYVQFKTETVVESKIIQIIK